MLRRRRADRKGDDDGATGIRRFRESAGRIESFTGLLHAARSRRIEPYLDGRRSTKFRNRTNQARTSRVTGLPFNRSLDRERERERERTKECWINESVRYTSRRPVCRLERVDNEPKQRRVHEKEKRGEGTWKIVRKPRLDRDQSPWQSFNRSPR